MINLNQAVATALSLLNDESKRELSLLSYVDPHTKYRTEFISLVGSGLGLFDGSNQPLLEDIVRNHAEKLHFLDLGPEGVSAQAAIRIVLAEMSDELRVEKQS